LSNVAPDPGRGRVLLVSRDSNCTLCHAAPETGERFFGNVGPSLSGAGARLTAAQMRLRIVDPLFFNKESIMPAYYRVSGLNRVAETYRGKPVLNAEQIEDVIAYLLTLK
jgi:sulfur-oxidizing protein SoxX